MQNGFFGCLRLQLGNDNITLMNLSDGTTILQFTILLNVISFTILVGLGSTLTITLARHMTCLGSLVLPLLEEKSTLKHTATTKTKPGTVCCLNLKSLKPLCFVMVLDECRAVRNRKILQSVLASWMPRKWGSKGGIS